MEKVPGKTKSKELNFQPITEGLGFHPFSDGLPYAPVGKVAQQKSLPTGPNLSGSGAIAAGPPSFTRPMIPSKPATLNRNPVPNRIAVPNRITVPVAPAATAPRMPAPVVPVTVVTDSDLTPVHGFGYLAKRMVAWILDSCLNLLLCAGALGIALWNQDINMDALLSPGIALLAVLFMALFNWALITAQEVAFGTSVGKRLFGLSLQGTATAIFLRAFFFLPSLGFCGLGLAWGLVDKRRRCWHDVVVDLQPAEYARL